MGDVVPMKRHRGVRIAIQRARRFRVEIPVVLAEVRADPQWWGEAIWRYVCEFAEDKGAGDVIPDLRVAFVGGLDAARAADQAWFTDYLSPGMILICYEALL
ncbi:hypothetical protein PHELEMICH_7 [Mycobacterium phage Phelemich]|uniref:Uncharacterized protein n=2 Tax=Acadianvirus reprobate TaxID=1982903 RepID=S5Z8W5_9CAUD|nr:hypothetical protein N847_gp07 [Mycobacterium phage Phelemich]YP_008409928.1 hypothetical protein REPROBATE_7 [Mycobacterium phage Reprobate]AGT12743.1 hypothetical protein REPROBATE_7 [Mycobacterium phage Reprobate]AGT13921.1 hypothetical protein PHELEMICH_7 [Mycobacterium phage Phelemich]